MRLEWTAQRTLALSVYRTQGRDSNSTKVWIISLYDFVTRRGVQMYNNDYITTISTGSRLRCATISPLT